MRPIPDVEAPTAPGAYYTGPDAKCTRPGWYYANSYDLSSRPLFDFVATTLHEAVPGHHLQIAIQQEADLPPFRAFGGWNAYIEGWYITSNDIPIYIPLSLLFVMMVLAWIGRCTLNPSVLTWASTTMTIGCLVAMSVRSSALSASLSTRVTIVAPIFSRFCSMI